MPGASTVGPVTAVVGLPILGSVGAIGLWAIRRGNRMFPTGFDRTGWSPERGLGSWFRTKFTWLSGGRG